MAQQDGTIAEPAGRRTLVGRSPRPHEPALAPGVGVQGSPLLSVLSCWAFCPTRQRRQQGLSVCRSSAPSSSGCLPLPTLCVGPGLSLASGARDGCAPVQPGATRPALRRVGRHARSCPVPCLSGCGLAVVIKVVACPPGRPPRPCQQSRQGGEAERHGCEERAGPLSGRGRHVTASTWPGVSASLEAPRPQTLRE